MNSNQRLSLLLGIIFLVLIANFIIYKKYNDDPAVHTRCLTSETYQVWHKHSPPTEHIFSIVLAPNGKPRRINGYNCLTDNSRQITKLESYDATLAILNAIVAVGTEMIFYILLTVFIITIIVLWIKAGDKQKPAIK